MLRWHVLSGCDVIMCNVLSCHFSTRRAKAFGCDVMFAGSGSFLSDLPTCAMMSGGGGVIAV